MGLQKIGTFSLVNFLFIAKLSIVSNTRQAYMYLMQCLTILKEHFFLHFRHLIANHEGVFY